MFETSTRKPEMGVFDEDIKEKIKEEMEVALSMRSKINRNK